MVLPVIAAGAGFTFGALSERFGWNVPNYRDFGNIAMGENTGVESNAFHRAKEILVQEEGRRNDVYKDTLGNLTVGIGHKVLPSDNLRLGDVISNDKVDQFFSEDASKAFIAAVNQAKEIDKYNVEMIARLTSVNFQLGTGWRSKFPNTWSLIKSGEITPAVRGLINSRWYQQTPTRVANLIQVLQSQFA